MKQLIKWSVPVVALALAMGSAQAATIVGTITFAGGVTLNSGSVNTATGVTGWQNAFVESDSGNFTVIRSLNANSVITPVTIVSPWSFLTTSTVNNFWSVTDSGETFTFNLTESGEGSQLSQPGNGTIGVVGTGTITGTGLVNYTSTIGTWTFTASDPSGANGVFSFQAANGTAAPDSGTTLSLLGAALAGLGLLKRKLSA